MNTRIIIFALMISALFNGCSNTTPKVEHSISHAEPLNMQGVNHFSKHPMYHYTCENGDTRVFYDMLLMKDGELFGVHELVIRDNDDMTTDSILPLVYNPFNANPDGFRFCTGCPTQFYYRITPDGKTLYVVTCYMMKYTGKDKQFQLFEVNCETKESQFLYDCIAIKATDNGFIMAKVRTSKKDTWLMHNEYIDWNGDIAHIESNEFDYETLCSLYLSNENTLISGFNRSFKETPVKSNN